MEAEKKTVSLKKRILLILSVPAAGFLYGYAMASTGNAPQSQYIFDIFVIQPAVYPYQYGLWMAVKFKLFLLLGTSAAVVSIFIFKLIFTKGFIQLVFRPQNLIRAGFMLLNTAVLALIIFGLSHLGSTVLKIILIAACSVVYVFLSVGIFRITGRK